MARRKMRKVHKRPARRNRISRRPRSSGKPSPGQLIAKGVKSLVSSVPTIGPIIANVADFAFRAIGLASSVSEESGQVLAEVENFMLAARFHVRLSSLLCGSRSCVQVDQGRQVLCEYLDGRVIQITIRVLPTNPSAKRLGEWCLTFQPFFSDGDETSAGFAPQLQGTVFPMWQEQRRAFLSVVGPADKPLVLRYRPRVTDGRAFGFQHLAAMFGEVSIMYRSFARTNKEAISVDEFSCETVVEGILECRTTPSAGTGTIIQQGTNASLVQGAYLYDVTVDDRLGGVKYMILEPGSFHVLTEHTERVVDDRCIVKGTCVTHGRRDSFEIVKMDNI